MLLSPRFLYVPLMFTTGKVNRTLDSYEIADRLSLLIWGRTPDAALLDRADKGELSNKDVLKVELDRLLADRKAAWAFFKDFAGQWLDTYSLKDMDRNYPDFASFTWQLEWEVIFFIEEMFRANHTVSEMLAADFTFVTSKIAPLYGVNYDSHLGQFADLNTPPQFAKIKLPPAQRRGLLTLAGVLTVNAMSPKEANPISRGYWVTKKILCRRPPPAPPNVVLPKDIDGSLPIKERLAIHRQSGTSCVSCHKLMDPIGLGLHSFDPVGRFRTIDSENHAVDPSGAIDGAPFMTSAEMADVISRSDDAKRCVMSHVATFAVSRPVDAQTSCGIRTLTTTNPNRGLKDLFYDFVQSPLFMKHQEE